MKTLYIGYDLGDGESIISYLLVNATEKLSRPDFLIMPTRAVHGLPIPTAYAIEDSGDIVLGNTITDITDKNTLFVSNFKKQPISLLQNISDDTYDALLEIFSKNDKQWPELNFIADSKLLELRNRIKTYTDTLFSLIASDEKFISLTKDIEKIVFCVGYPTRWKSHGRVSLDVAIYKKILQQTLIGQDYFLVDGTPYNADLLLEAESRAAFLYARQVLLNEHKREWIMDKSRLLIDIGSSTTDITAFRKSSLGGGSYNTGHSFLGAQIFDFLLLDWFMQNLQLEEREYLLAHMTDFPDVERRILLCCRKVKEDIYTNLCNPQNNGKEIKRKIEFEIEEKEFSLKITSTEVRALEDKPIAPVIKKCFFLPEDTVRNLKDFSWKELFKNFIAKQKTYIEKHNYELEEILLTGSASQMPFITEICHTVFGDGVVILHDVNPAVAIASGLSLVGATHEKSAVFRKASSVYMVEKFPKTIETYFDEYVDIVTAGITNVILNEIIITELKKWCGTKNTTINDIMNNIQTNCSQNLFTYLKKDKKYIADIKNWNSKLAKKIDRDIKFLCKNYSNDFQNLTLGEENLSLKSVITPNLSIADKITTPVATIMNIVSTIVIIALMIIVPKIISIPGYLVAVGASCLQGDVEKAISNAKKSMDDKIINAKLPTLTKKLLYRRIEEEIEQKKSEIQVDVKAALSTAEMKKSMLLSLQNNMKIQINEVIKRIEYIIEDEQ